MVDKKAAAVACALPKPSWRSCSWGWGHSLTAFPYFYNTLIVLRSPKHFKHSASCCAKRSFCSASLISCFFSCSPRPAPRNFEGLIQRELNPSCLTRRVGSQTGCSSGRVAEIRSCIRSFYASPVSWLEPSSVCCYFPFRHLALRLPHRRVWAPYLAISNWK